MYTLKKNNTSPLYVMCTPMPRITPLPTLMLVRMWDREFTLWTLSKAYIVGGIILNIIIT